MDIPVRDYFASFFRPKCIANPPYWQLWTPPEERIPVFGQAIPLPYKDEVIPTGEYSQQFTPTVDYSPKFILTRDKRLKRSAPIDDCYVEILPPLKRFKVDINMDCSCPYPLEMWMEISKYIAPEDVSSFARICKHTLTVVKSAIFWRQMYHRYYKPSVPVPCVLREAVKNKCGLRASVIRSMYYMYPPYINKLQVTDVPFSKLQNMVCFEQRHEFNHEMKYGMSIFMFQELPFIQLFVARDDEYRLGVCENKYEGAIALKLTFRELKPPKKMVLGMAVENITAPQRRPPLCNYALLELYDPFGIRHVQKFRLLMKHVMAVQVQNWWAPCFFHTHPFPAEKQPHFNICM